MNEHALPLTYAHHAPRRASGSDAPLLILLHGRGTDENDLAGLLQFLDPRFEAVSIRAPYPFEYGGYTWFALDETIGRYDRAQLDEGLKGILDVVQKESGKGRKVFLYGFSMGAMMALAASLTHPELFRGCVAHSGLVPEQADHLSIDWKRIGSCAFFIAHGTYDPVVSVDYARRGRELFSHTDAAFLYREYPMGHEISPESLRDTSDWLTSLIDRA